MGNNGHAYQRFERVRTLTNAIHHLDMLVYHLRAAHHYNLTYDLKLELPSEATFIEQISKAVEALERAQVPPVTTGSITA